MPTALPRGQGWYRVFVGLSALDCRWVAWRRVFTAPGDPFGNLCWEWLGVVGSPRLGWGGGAGSPRWRQRPVWSCGNSEPYDRPRAVPGAPRHLVCVRPCLSFPSRETHGHSHLAGGCGSQAGPCAWGTGRRTPGLVAGSPGTPAADRLAGGLASASCGGPSRRRSQRPE